MWRSLLPILGLCSCSRRFGCRFRDSDNNNNSCLRGVTGGRSRFLFRDRDGFGGPHRQCYLDSISGALAISKKKKKKRVWTCFFFLTGQSQSHIAIGLGKRGSRTVALLHTKFCGCHFFLVDAAFSKLVAGRTLNDYHTPPTAEFASKF